jgi:hypothetical protein
VWEKEHFKDKLREERSKKLGEIRERSVRIKSIRKIHNLNANYFLSHYH